VIAGHGPVDIGPGALDALAERVAETGAARVFLVTGRASFSASGASKIVAALERSSTVIRWSDFDPNTDVVDLWSGLSEMRRAGADAVVGIGGGSVMDMAKLLCVYRDIESEADLHTAIRSGESVTTRSIPLMLAPTTSGSGSEATHFAVVYIGADKFSIAGSGLRADATALDPTLALSGSAHQRATSGMDAVCQAIESRWAAGGTRRSRRYAEFALRLLLADLEQFVASPNLQNSRAVQLGSHLAGRAIDISKTTAAHALSYGITKRYGVDHGNAAALTLGYFIVDHASPDVQLQDSVDPSDHAAAMSFIVDALGAQDGASARTNFVGLLDRLGLPSTLTAVGYESPDELIDLAATVNAQRLGNNPAVYSADDLRRVLERAT
jgi:alcohol dehydrogenase class IV